MREEEEDLGFREGKKDGLRREQGEMGVNLEAVVTNLRRYAIIAITGNEERCFLKLGFVVGGAVK